LFEALHERNKGRAACAFCQEMQVVRHKAIGVYRKAVLFTYFVENGQAFTHDVSIVECSMAVCRVDSDAVGEGAGVIEVL
jgi:hypothetical protein